MQYADRVHVHTLACPNRLVYVPDAASLTRICKQWRMPSSTWQQAGMARRCLTALSRWCRCGRLVRVGSSTTESARQQAAAACNMVSLLVQWGAERCCQAIDCVASFYERCEGPSRSQCTCNTLPCLPQSLGLAGMIWCGGPSNGQTRMERFWFCTQVLVLHAYRVAAP